MGNKDIATKKYMSDNVRFADVFNYAIYGGRQIIKHDMLKEISAEELLLMEGDKEKLSVKECRCSTLQKLWENQHHYVYISIVANIVNVAGNCIGLFLPLPLL